MPRTIEATISKDGTIRLTEQVNLPGPRRALVTILEEQPLDRRDGLEDDRIGQAGLAIAGKVLEPEDFSDWPTHPGRNGKEATA